MDPAPDSAPLRDLMHGLPLLEGLAPDDLDLLLGMAHVEAIAEGAYLMREGESGDTLYLVVEGELEILTAVGQVVATRGVGEVVGEMAVLQRAPRSASVRALCDGRLLAIGHDAFATLLSRSPTASLTILGTIVGRLRSSELLLMQNEKIAALGTMAAGLAHELNNPAAAIARSTGQLRDALEAWEAGTADVASLALDAEAARTVAELRASLAERAAQLRTLDPLDRSEREDALLDWLEDLGVDSAWELAPVLVEAGWSVDELRPRFGTLPDDGRPAVARWLAAGTALYALLGETRTSAEAISQLVDAVKSYSYLDQAPVQEVDLHEGLESTLVVLKHKLRDVAVQRDYDPDLPRIEAFGSALNQVWTNLIDNAIDAMGGSGVIELRTEARPDGVVVEIRDDGPGIPDELRQRILEPFFTTKAVGSGMGLGLHIVYDIVVNRHGGHLYVESEPGATTFRVALPLTPAERPG